VTLAHKQAPERNVARLRLSAILLLALGAWVHPALSATGADARCDQRLDAPPMSAADNGKLAIQVLDHGTDTTVSRDDISREAAAVVPALEPYGRPGGPKVDVMLRRVIDDTQLQQSPLSETEQVDDESAPLAIGKTEAIEEPATALDNDQSDFTAELPGFSGDELLRYREQMFRKDI
jgi:hypothetical protein